MGGSVSSGRSNDELVDNLVEGGLIKTQMVERVFRAVDRGVFYLPKFKEAAYRDLAWREGLIHISAPCIYTRVMEALELDPGLSFLNIGSGTGYFSTMVGLILGENGINHNIELHKEIIDYGKQKITEFVKNSSYFDDFDFCIPKFVNGNVLNLNVNNENQILYDRVYVGVGISTEHELFIKSLVKVNGIIVMPLNDNLVKIKRVSETTYESSSLMTVSFASLVTENFDSSSSFSLPALKPLSLQEICRFRIRKCIREGIKRDHADFYEIKREVSTFNKKRLEELREKELLNNESDGDELPRHSSLQGNMYCPLTRFERLFTPRRTQERQDSSERSNTYFENQLRMMIYGRLLDPSSTINAIAFQPTQNEENANNNNNNNNLAESQRNNAINTNNNNNSNNDNDVSYASDSSETQNNENLLSADALIAMAIRRHQNNDDNDDEGDDDDDGVNEEDDNYDNNLNREDENIDEDTEATSRNHNNVPMEHNYDNDDVDNVTSKIDINNFRSAEYYKEKNLLNEEMDENLHLDENDFEENTRSVSTLFSNLNIPLKPELQSAISNVDSGISENSIESQSMMQSSCSLDNWTKLSSGSAKQQKRKMLNEYPDDNSFYPSESDSSSVSNGSSTAENCSNKRQTNAQEKAVALSHKSDDVSCVTKENNQTKNTADNDSDSDEYQGPPCKNATPKSFCKFARCNKPGCASNNRPSEPEIKRENLLHQRIMGLPLSEVVKSFLLYNRDT